MSATAQQKMKKSGLDHLLTAMILLAVLMTFLLILVPLLSGIALSFLKIDSFALDGLPSFAGLGNFESLFSTGAFNNALKNGIIFSAASVVIQLVLATLVALILNQTFPGRAFVRTALIFPMLIPPVVVSLLFRWMNNQSFGIFPKWLQSFGMEPIAWNTPELAMTQVVLLGVWMWTPFMTVSILAELQSIPSSLYEAARVDGAGPFSQFFHVTLPHLLSVMSIIVLLRMIWTFNNFELIWLTTGGDPLTSTDTLPVLSYRQSFTLYELGTGAATATVSFGILLAVVLIATRFLPVNKD